MTTLSIEEQVREFIINNFLFGMDNGLSMSDSLLKAGVIDSTGVLELISYLENTFHISLDDVDLTPENLDSLDNIAAMIRRKQSERPLSVQSASAG